MLTLFESLFLGMVQGLTEWLPVSSSGHLVIVQQLLGIQAGMSFDLFLHAGTLAALFIFFRKEIADILKSVLRFDFKSESGRMALFIVIGSVPIAVAGFLLGGIVEPLFSSLLSVSIALIITGAVLQLTRLAKLSGKLDVKNSLIIGAAQAIAMVPGISRSGLTISASLLRGIDRKKAFAFSFLLAIPAIIGANIVHVSSLELSLEAAAGAVAAAFTGYLALVLLKKTVLAGRLHMFSYYCWAVGAIFLAISLYGA